MTGPRRPSRPAPINSTAPPPAPRPRTPWSSSHGSWSTCRTSAPRARPPRTSDTPTSTPLNFPSRPRSVRPGRAVAAQPRRRDDCCADGGEHGVNSYRLAIADCLRERGIIAREISDGAGNIEHLAENHVVSPGRRTGPAAGRASIVQSNLTRAKSLTRSP